MARRAQVSSSRVSPVTDACCPTSCLRDVGQHNFRPQIRPGAARSTSALAGRVPYAVDRVPTSVLHIASHLMGGAFGLIQLAFLLQLLVPESVPCGFLHFAFDIIRNAFNVFFVHGPTSAWVRCMVPALRTPFGRII